MLIDLDTKSWKLNNISNAEVTELVDVVDSKSTESNLVGVRVPLSAPPLLPLIQ